MNTIVRNRMPLFVAAALIALGALAVINLQPAHAQHEGGSMAAPRYTVVATEVHNLIVTDNHANELYFYTIDQNAEVGSELKLRGRVDLAQVGKPVIKPVTHKAKEGS
jgi:hypothetical protein